MDDEKLIYHRLDRKLIHKGHIVDYYQDTVQVPNGETEEWDFVAHKGAAASVPVLPDGRILMVKQYRNALDRFTLEIPAGGLNAPGEPTLIAAARELEEETGYRPGNMELLLTVQTTVAFTNERIDIYLATDLEKTVQHLDHDEFLKVEAYSLEELMGMIESGTLEDSKTVSALLKYKVFCADARS
ncbi:MAG: NUDIX hydrolase [Lachnospiraceae bacterium]|nr:NUDIX hydrolase [Lachnospiraceae bacterium]